MATINGNRPVNLSPYLRIVEKTMSQDVANNRTQLRVQLYFVVDKGTIAYHLNKPGRLTVSPGGSVSFKAPNRYLGSRGSYLLKEYWVWVPHNNDGTCQVNLSATYDVGITWNGQFINRMSVSGAVDLPKIPRGSKIASASMGEPLKAGETNYLNISLDLTFTDVEHNIMIYDRNGNKFIGQWMGLANPTQLDMNAAHVQRMLDRMNNQASKNDFEVRVWTKRNGKDMGMQTRTFTATVDDDSAKPTIFTTEIVRKGDKYDSTINEYVQNVTEIRARFRSDANSGAVVRSRKITIRRGSTTIASGGKVEDNYFVLDSGVLTGYGTHTIEYRIEDSRGFVNTSTQTINVLAYSPPSISSFWAFRNNGRLNLSFRRTYSSLSGENKLSISVSAKERGGDSENIHDTTSTTSSQTQTLQHYGASDAKAYDYTLTITDQFGNKAEAVTNIGTAVVLMAHWQDKATGFGMFPSKKGVSSKHGYFYGDNEIPLIESGSNANGDWIKLYDGTLICVNRGLNVTYTNSASLTKTWTYPYSFIDLPIVNSGRRADWYNTQTSSAVSGVDNLTKSDCQVKVMVDNGSFSSSSSRYVDLIAIGRWRK